MNNTILGQDKAKKALNVAIKRNIPALLIGQTGCGKTSIIRELALKNKRTFSRFNMTGETSVDEFVGKYTLINSETVWQDGILVRAMKEGHWLVVDEINVALPEVLLIMNSLLDDDRSVTLVNHDGEVIKCHPNFRFFGTMNPTDEYAGTKELNKAFLSRFGMVLEMSYPTKEIETKILVQAEVEEDTAKKLVDTALRIRQAKSEGKVFYTCSTRDLLQWAELIPHLGLERGFELSVMAKASHDQASLKEIYESTIAEWSEVEKLVQTLNSEEMKTRLADLDKRERVISRDETRIKNMEADAKRSMDEAKKLQVKSREDVRKEVLKEINERMQLAVSYVNQA